jgi:hypothetical protein
VPAGRRGHLPCDCEGDLGAGAAIVLDAEVGELVVRRDNRAVPDDLWPADL